MWTLIYLVDFIIFFTLGCFLGFWFVNKFFDWQDRRETQR